MENSQARFDELKAIGWANLKGEQRKEFNALKAELEGGMVEHTVTQEDLDQNPDLVDQGVAVGDVIEVNKDDLTPETLHETAEINDTSDLAEASVGMAPVVPSQPAQYVMTENVRHNDQEFKIGQDIAADHKFLPDFLSQGFAREKKLS